MGTSDLLSTTNLETLEALSKHFLDFQASERMEVPTLGED